MVLALLAACGGDITYPGPRDSGGDPGDSATPADSAESGQPDDSGPNDSPDPPDDTGGDSGGDSGGPEPVAPAAVILFIGDGMGFAHVEGGGEYVYGSAGSLQMEGLPIAGRLRTASLSGITDSAASATAMATGTKTSNGRLGLDRDGISVESILEKARARGMSVGVVTTDTLTGATPSAFVVHIDDRGDGPAIAQEYMAGLPDVALGGGYADFEGGLSTLSANVVTTAAELSTVTPDGRPLLGLFSVTELPFVADGYTSEQPSLATMTAAAIDWLDDDPDGFFLMVESARIDHASHSNAADRVFDEVAALDAAVGSALDWADAASGHTTTVLVTADHECGGLTINAGNGVGAIPDTTWRWGRHTNAEVPVFGRGDLASILDGATVDNLWVNAVLSAAVEGAASVADPGVPVLVDGYTDDLGPAVTTQIHTTSYGTGYNQLDALHIYGDADGLHIGIDGVFERGANAPVVWIDLDWGSGTGAGADVTLADWGGGLDNLLSNASFTSSVAGLGFDVAVGAIGAEEVEEGFLYDYTGLRGLHADWGSESDFAWLDMISNYDDGNIAEGTTARDADGAGLTENGWEMLLPWTSLWSGGVPATGASLAVWVELVNENGNHASNQALPPFASGDEPGEGAAPIDSVVAFDVDASGAIVGTPAVVP
jgi:alkaline phosphatase